MKTKLIKKFDKPPPKAFNNEYPTSHYQFKNPMLMMVCGVQNSTLTSSFIQIFFRLALPVLPVMSCMWACGI